MNGITKEQFIEGLSINCNGNTEQKGDLTYLSWVFAEAECRKLYPNARFEATKFVDHGVVAGWDAAAIHALAENEALPMVPYLFVPEKGYLIHVIGWLEPGFESAELWFPILLHGKKEQPKPHMNPTVFDVNTAIMRAKTKLISMMTGIGLYIYAGEDLPDNLVDSSTIADEATVAEFLKLIDHPDMNDEKVKDGKTRGELIRAKYDQIGWDKAEMKKDTEKVTRFIKARLSNADSRVAVGAS